MKNAYLEKKRLALAERDAITKVLTIQMVWDTMSMTLNDPAVMGKNTLGAVRLKRVLEAWSDCFADCYAALTESAEADVIRAHMDRRLSDIFGADFMPFEMRYSEQKRCSAISNTARRKL